MQTITYREHTVEIIRDEIGDGLYAVIIESLGINHLCDNKKVAKQTARELIDQALGGAL
jgi:hypothetical protein